MGDIGVGEWVVAGGLCGGWRVTGDQGPAEDRAEVAPPAEKLMGAPIAFRGAASLRSALQPVAEFYFRRTERLHLEWPVLQALTARKARLLDRRGQPLGSEIPVTDRELAPGRPGLAVDLGISAIPEGDYAIELSGSAGSDTEVQIVAFRVGR